MRRVAAILLMMAVSASADMGGGDGEGGHSPRAGQDTQPTYSAGLGKRIVLIGDSYFAGSISDPILRANIQEGETSSCWRRMCMSSIIEDYFSANVPGVNVKNVGVGGSNTRDWSPTDFNIDDVHWQDRMEPLFDRIPAGNIAVIHLGGNDITGIYETPGRGMGKGHISTREYKRNLARIVDTLTHRGFEHVVIVGTVTPPNWYEGHAFRPQPNPLWNKFGRRHRLIREAAQDFVELRNHFEGQGGRSGRVSYLDTHLTPQAQNQIGYWDGTGNVHPAINGHHHIGKLIAEHIYEDVLDLGTAPSVPHPLYNQ